MVVDWIRAHENGTFSHYMGHCFFRFCVKVSHDSWVVCVHPGLEERHSTHALTQEALQVIHAHHAKIVTSTDPIPPLFLYLAYVRFVRTFWMPKYVLELDLIATLLRMRH